MAFDFRRVVTGHDEEGRAVVALDETLSSEPRLEGYDAKVVWCTPAFPPSNDGFSVDDDASGPWGGRVLFRVAEFEPGTFTAANMHRTETQDIAIVVSGELEMELDGGDRVERLGPGDVVVQRGTMHSWAVRSGEPVRVLFVLMDAPPARVGERVLRQDVSVFDGKVFPMPPVD
ncbi:cupin domain-containing protein [Pseudonocardia yuanmonensis]|uniref:Cupin domain-containing protein n=1 Tax=Pseudonocardia yuanmonensis TaxID=1095914 RepID=A0ABP8XNI2_9PSEU